MVAGSGGGSQTLIGEGAIAPLREDGDVGKAQVRSRGSMTKPGMCGDAIESRNVGEESNRGREGSAGCWADSASAGAVGGKSVPHISDQSAENHASGKIKEGRDAC